MALSDVEDFLRRAACKHRLEGIVSKRLDRPYLPGERGAWIKTKCLNRAEFVVVGWSDPEGSRPLVGALLLGYFESDCRRSCRSLFHNAQAGELIARLASTSLAPI